VQIDARGFGCPKPVMMAEKALSQIDEGTIEVLVDNEASVKNLTRFAAKQGMYVETGKEDTYWTVKIVKGYPCEIESASGGQPLKYERREKDIFMIIGTDTLGKEEELGKILMKGFIETMKVTKELPHTIFFLNAGVKLTTVNEETVSILKEIEDFGVEIFSCGTCLKYYNLEDELKVGYRGTTNHIVEGIKDFKKVVWV